MVTPRVRAAAPFECAARATTTGAPPSDLPRGDAGSLVAAEIMGAIYFGILRRIERAGYDVFSRRDSRAAWRRALIALRIWVASLLARPSGCSGAGRIRAFRSASSRRRVSRADVVVIGGGFAGLSAATGAGGARRAGASCSRPGPTLGGRASAFTDPATGERVDNGQHVLFGCYHETFRVLAPHRRRSDVVLQHGLVDGHRRRGTALVARSRALPLPAPLHLLAGPAGGGRRHRLAAIKRRPRCGSARARDAASVRETVRQLAGPARPDATPDRVAVGAAGGRGAEPADRRRPRAGPFAAVLGRMLGRPRGRVAGVAGVEPLDELFADPARAFIEERGGQVRTQAPAQRALRRRARPRVDVEAHRWARARSICAVAWHALARAVPGPACRASPDMADAAARTPASPIVTVTCGSTAASWTSPLRRASRTALAVGVRQVGRLFGDQASATLSRGRRAPPTAWSDDSERGRSSTLALAAVRERDAGRAHGRAAPRPSWCGSAAPRSRWPRGSRRGPRTRTGVPGFFLAGDWIETGLPATIESAVASGHARRPRRRTRSTGVRES